MEILKWKMFSAHDSVNVLALTFDHIHKSEKFNG